MPTFKLISVDRIKNMLKAIDGSSGGVPSLRKKIEAATKAARETGRLKPGKMAVPADVWGDMKKSFDGVQGERAELRMMASSGKPSVSRKPKRGSRFGSDYGP